MKFQKVKMTKKLAEQMAHKREKMFKDLTTNEISALQPVNKAYLYENPTKTDVRMFIQSCVLCGATHYHGNAGNGLYSPHCINLDPKPNYYKIEIDMTDKDNQMLAKKYRIEMN